MITTRSRLAVILLTVFIDLAGFGIVLPILPYYAERMGVGGLGFGALIGVFSLMQFAATIVLGQLSDRVGRRPVLLWSISLGAVGYVLFAFAGTYTPLILARMVSGFAAGNISVAQAYMADVTTPAERSRGMGLVGAAVGLGLIVGPALGGIAGHRGGPPAAGLTAAALCVANVVSAFFILEESLAPDRRVTRRLLDAEHLARGLRDRALRPAFLVFGIIPFAFSGYMVALPLYAEQQFGWGERELGWFFTIVGIMAAAVQGYLFGKLVRRVGDRALAVAGLFGMALAIGVVPFLGSGAALYAWVIVLAFSNSVASPAIIGIVSTLAAATEQGAMLGAAQALSALGRFTGPVLYGQAYDALGARAAFLAAAAVMGAGWLVSFGMGRREQDDLMPPPAPADGRPAENAAPRASQGSRTHPPG
jgi:predicted MFS family arabinose efflux permease